MQPRYLTPAPEARRTINLEPKARQVEAWLASLPRDDAPASAHRLVELLMDLNRADGAGEARERLVDSLSPAVLDTVTQLRRLYRVTALPLAPYDQRLADLASQLLEELAHLHKHVLREESGSRFRVFGGDTLATRLSRLVSALGQLLELRCELHEPPPPGLWSDLHQAYAQALHLGLARPSGKNRGVGGEAGIEDRYKTSLLLALSDPFHMPVEELHWIRNILVRFGPLARLKPIAEFGRPTSVFVVEAELDEPPRPLARDRRAIYSRQDMALDTLPLARQLALLANHLSTGGEPADVGLPIVATHPGYLAMLNRLKLQWGASLQRMTARRRLTGVLDCQVCLGLESIHALLGHAAAPPASEPRLALCHVVNDSRGGVALALERPSLLRLRVGELAALRLGDSEQWQIGIVRWFKTPPGGQILFGVQNLANGAQPVRLLRDVQPAAPALLLSVGTQAEAILVAPPDLLTVGGMAEIERRDGIRPMRVERRVNHTHRVEIFRLSPA